nr:IS200/IS605 family transposase [Desulfofarcimen acetoxidans]
MEYKSNNNVVYSCKYHVVWCPKYRREVLTQGVDVRLKELIYQICSEHQSEILELEIIKQYIENQKKV